MGDWTDGYVSDVEYSAGFYAEQMPAHIDVACLVRGIEPPVRRGESFRYCELGCGVGKSAATIAATSPHGQVWGFDFNPAHIARGRRLCQEGGLSNLILEERSFQELVGPYGTTLPRFHYIALHGVWSWVSPQNQRHIVDFIAQHLEPGGAVYVTYNALPGWNTAAPLQRALWASAGFDNDRSDRRILRAMAFARRMADAGARTIPRDFLGQLDKQRDNDNIAYLAHEYLNAHWAPSYQMDVAEALAEAKVGFAASADILESFPDICLTGEQRQLVDEAPLAYRETIKDYFAERTFRRDIYIRGACPIAPRRVDSRLRTVQLTAVVPRTALTREISVPIGNGELSEPLYGPALKAIANGTPSVGELLDQGPGGTATPQEVLGMLVGSRQAMSVLAQPSDAARDRVRRYNAAQLRACADLGKAVTALAGVSIGSAVTVRLFEMLVYEALVDGVPAEVDAMVNDCWKRLKSRGDRVVSDGALVDDEAASRALLEKEIPKVLEVGLPIWRRIGAI